ncbi:hypothetical protein AvCA_43880 [Azotobacter vinelandii CA]|uniref:Uncharacterized protein n=2 Tax=Azotobacter vinelandii TaxID=354 RepID=C1DGL3_AZOVD|nr:hypothetical protein Avin_43880 [Azotobacter vinelandii DJ]AGK14381.1 hypothetical protein AvCA_43880 [Azotobacter vinelandii CA]AGK21962.1 hypothetical protein AvCA6_43880 [Azotobacter vinelandii CA6]
MPERTGDFRSKENCGEISEDGKQETRSCRKSPTDRGACRPPRPPPLPPVLRDICPPGNTLRSKCCRRNSCPSNS